jgi:predicted ATP-grasp superfamily ATP-dependent carboligase
MVRRYSITEPGLLPILQESVDGDDYCSAFLFDHGEYRASMTYHNLFDFPRGKGVGALRETVDAHRLEEIGRVLLGRLGWNGVCQVDFRWDGVSEPWLIEVNPRFWGGLAQSVASGWPFPVWAYELALTGHVDAGKPQKIDVRTSNPILMASRIMQDLFTARDGRIKAVARLIKESRGSVNEFFSWSDPLPVLGFLYPLMVYFKHGVISPELLIGEKGMHKDDPIKL